MDERGQAARLVSFSIATRMMSAPIAALPGCTDMGAVSSRQIGPRPKRKRSRRLPRNGCRASIFCSQPRRARRDLLARACRRRRCHCRSQCRARQHEQLSSSVAQTKEAPRRPLRRQYGLPSQYRRGDVVRDAHLAETALRRAVSVTLRHRRPGAPREVMDLARQPGIVVAGGFDDAAPLYRRAALAVVPIRAGGGTRIKLLESAKHGVPVVATRVWRRGHRLPLWPRASVGR